MLSTGINIIKLLRSFGLLLQAIAIQRKKKNIPNSTCFKN